MIAKRQKFSESCKHGHLRLRKSASSGIWQVRYRDIVSDPSGQRCIGGYRYNEVSLGTTIKKEAIRHAELLNTQIANHTMGVADGTIPLTTMCERFFEAKKLHFRAEGMKRLQSSKNNFERWIAVAHPEIRKAGDVTMQVVREFQSYRLSQGKGKRTIDNDIMNLHSIYLWAKRERLVDTSPFDYSKHSNVDLFKDVSTKRDVYTPDEYKALIAEADRIGDIMVLDLIITLANTGMRFEEAAHLVPEALDWTAKIPVIEIRARNGWMPKDKDEVKTPPMSPEVQEVMKRREAEAKGGFLFQNSAGNKIAANKTRERLQALFPKVGIDPSRRLHWHSWRNFFVIKCVNAHVTVRAIMSWLGHDSASMVLHYAKARDNEGAEFDEFSKIL